MVKPIAKNQETTMRVPPVVTPIQVQVALVVDIAVPKVRHVSVTTGIAPGRTNVQDIIHTTTHCLPDNKGKL